MAPTPTRTEVVITRADGHSETIEIDRRKLLFIDEYMKDHRGSKAVVRAGYCAVSPEVQAYKFLSDPKINAIVEDRERQRALQIGIDVEWVVREFVKNLYSAKAEGDFTAVNRTLELIGKHMGMFIDRRAIDVTSRQVNEVRRVVVHAVLNGQDDNFEHLIEDRVGTEADSP